MNSNRDDDEDLTETSIHDLTAAPVTNTHIRKSASLFFPGGGAGGGVNASHRSLDGYSTSSPSQPSPQTLIRKILQQSTPSQQQKQPIRLSGVGIPNELNNYNNSSIRSLVTSSRQRSSSDMSPLTAGRLNRSLSDITSVTRSTGNALSSSFATPKRIRGFFLGSRNNSEESITSSSGGGWQDLLSNATSGSPDNTSMNNPTIGSNRISPVLDNNINRHETGSQLSETSTGKDGLQHSKTDKKDGTTPIVSNSRRSRFHNFGWMHSSDLSGTLGSNNKKSASLSSFNTQNLEQTSYLHMSEIELLEIDEEEDDISGNRSDLTKMGMLFSPNATNVVAKPVNDESSIPKNSGQQSSPDPSTSYVEDSEVTFEIDFEQGQEDDNSERLLEDIDARTGSGSDKAIRGTLRLDSDRSADEEKGELIAIDKSLEHNHRPRSMSLDSARINKYWHERNEPVFGVVASAKSDSGRNQSKSVAAKPAGAHKRSRSFPRGRPSLSHSGDSSDSDGSGQLRKSHSFRIAHRHLSMSSGSSDSEYSTRSGRGMTKRTSMSGGSTHSRRGSLLGNASAHSRRGAKRLSNPSEPLSRSHSVPSNDSTTNASKSRTSSPRRSSLPMVLQSFSQSNDSSDTDSSADEENNRPTTVDVENRPKFTSESKRKRKTRGSFPYGQSSFNINDSIQTDIGDATVGRQLRGTRTESDSRSQLSDHAKRSNIANEQQLATVSIFCCNCCSNVMIQRISVLIATKLPCFWCSSYPYTEKAVLSRLNGLAVFCAIIIVGLATYFHIILLAPGLADRTPLLNYNGTTDEDNHTSISSNILITSSWNQNGSILFCGVIAFGTIIIAMMNIRVIHSVNLIGAMRYLWCLFWLIPILSFFVVGLFDGYRTTQVWINFSWREPYMALFRQYFCNPVEYANTLCAVPKLETHELELAWCKEQPDYNEKYNCVDLRSAAQYRTRVFLLSFNYVAGGWGAVLIILLSLISKILEGIISHPLVQKSTELNMPTWLLLPAASCLGIGAIFAFSSTSVVNVNAAIRTEAVWIGPLFMIAGILFFASSMLAWFMSAYRVLSTTDKRSKSVAILLFIVLMCSLLVLLTVLAGSTIAFTLSSIDTSISSSRRGDLACQIDQGRTCSRCDQPFNRCPEFPYTDIARIVQGQTRAGTTLAIISIIYCVLALRFGFNQRRSLSSYQIEYV